MTAWTTEDFDDDDDESEPDPRGLDWNRWHNDSGCSTCDGKGYLTGSDIPAFWSELGNGRPAMVRCHGEVHFR